MRFDVRGATCIYTHSCSGGYRNHTALGSRCLLSSGNLSAMCICPRLPQTGKSYNLEHVVPAVVAEALCKQQQQAGQQQQQQTDQAEDGGGEAPLLAGMIVLRLRGDKLVRKVGTSAPSSGCVSTLVTRWNRKAVYARARLLPWPKHCRFELLCCVVCVVSVLFLCCAVSVAMP